MPTPREFLESRSPGSPSVKNSSVVARQRVFSGQAIYRHPAFPVLSRYVPVSPSPWSLPIAASSLFPLCFVQRFAPLFPATLSVIPPPAPASDFRHSPYLCVVACCLSVFCGLLVSRFVHFPAPRRSYRSATGLSPCPWSLFSTPSHKPPLWPSVALSGQKESPLWGAVSRFHLHCSPLALSVRLQRSQPALHILHFPFLYLHAPRQVRERVPGSAPWLAPCTESLRDSHLNAVGIEHPLPGHWRFSEYGTAHGYGDCQL